MKKIISTIAIAMTFASVASADFARIEMGAGAWMQTPTGAISYTDTTGYGIADKSTDTAQTEGYAWILVKHPVPVIPNLRLEYVSAASEGTYEITGTPTISGAPTLDGASKLEMTQIDVIPYYNILDNTFWITLDLGLDVKMIELSYTSDGVDVMETLGVDLAGVVLPLGYVRARVQVPGMNFGFEADVKYVSFDGNSVSDVRVKADYTLDFIPIIQPAIEIGYRMQSFDLSDSGFSIKNDYAGVYAGVMLRF